MFFMFHVHVHKYAHLLSHTVKVRLFDDARSDKTSVFYVLRILSP
jgi:hypothetical protein